MTKKLDYKLLAAAAAAGWMSVLLSGYSIPLDNLYGTKVIWSLSFPLLIAIVWDYFFGNYCRREAAKRSLMDQQNEVLMLNTKLEAKVQLVRQAVHAV